MPLHTRAPYCALVAIAVLLGPIDALRALDTFREAPAAGARLPVTAERAIAGVTADELRGHVTVLASDEFGGRGVGQAGNRQAEAYVEAAMRRAGAAPAVSGGYLHPLAIYQPAVNGNGRVTIDHHDESLLDLKTGADFFPFPESGAATVSGPLVFAGYGISAPRHKHDDFAARDVRGAIVLALEGSPQGLLDGEDHASSVERKAGDAAAHGAVGLIVLTDHVGHIRARWPEQSSAAAAHYRLSSDVQKNGLPVVAISAGVAGGVRTALEAGAKLTVTLSPGVKTDPLPIHNVLGIVEGRDAARIEMMIVGAHLDHDGVDSDGRVYNGADDNASGTAAVLAIAGAFARAAAAGERPRRAVLFALWNAEEKGSLGAEAYLRSPDPPRRIVANINLDMVGRAENVPDPHDPRFRGFSRKSPAETANVLHLLGYTYSTDLAAIVAQANREIGLTIQQQYDHGAQDLLRRSDNWPFLKRGIPAVFLTTGLHPDYHTPDDDVERLDFGKLERIARLAARAAWLVADGPAPRLNQSARVP